MNRRTLIALWGGLLLLPLSPPNSLAGLEVINMERGPADPSDPSRIRLRATLAYIENGSFKSQPLEFWQNLGIKRKSTDFVAGSGDVLLEPLEGNDRGAWRIIILVDASRSMLRLEGEQRRYEVALSALEKYFLPSLAQFDVQVAIEAFDCTLKWAEDYKRKDGEIWMGDAEAMAHKVVKLRQRFEKMKRRTSKTDRFGMCTSLYQAMAEADRAMIELREDDPARQPLLIIIGDGQNDLSDYPGRVWTASQPPPRLAPHQLLASVAELRGDPPHRRTDLFELYDLAVEQGVAENREDARQKMLDAYRDFIRQLRDNRYVRWTVSVGDDKIFDEEVVQALNAKPISATNAAKLQEVLSGLAQDLHHHVRVNFPTDAVEPSELNSMSWIFQARGKEVGSFTPSKILAVATDLLPSCESWETYCQGRPHRTPWVAYIVVMGVLLGLWLLVPRYVFEARREAA